MQTKPQIVQYLNPKLPRNARVNLSDGREATLVCERDQRFQRLMAFAGKDRPELTNVNLITGGRMPNGAEFRCTFNGHALVEPR